MSSRPSRGAARLAAILDALPDALVLVNANGTVVNANTIALEAFETPGTALVGRGLLDLLPEFDSKLIPGSMRRPDHMDPRGRTKPTRMTARRTDGTEFPVEVTSANLENGQQAYDTYGYASDELLMLVVRDLSGTVDTEAELARSQRQTEMILRAASEGVVGTDTDGRIVLVNPAAAQILGYRASDLGGRELHTLVLHSRADGAPFPYDESPLADTLRSGRKHRVRGQVLWSKKGDPVSVDLTTGPVRDGDQLVGAVMTFTDRRPYDGLAEEKDALEERHAQEVERLSTEHASALTALREQHAAELEELRENHAEDLAAGEERYAALGEREKDRYEALAARHEQLLTLLGQSLRGPLDELRRELSALAADDAGQLWPEANQVLHHLSAGYARITTLIDNVLGFQRLDTGGEALTRSKVMLDAVVAAGVDGAVELVGPGRVQFAVHAPPIEAEVDARLLATALAHLVADVAGVDATGNARVTTGGYMDNTVVVAAAQRGEVVRIEVRGPYAGGDPVHEPIVRGIVRAHGGVLQTHEMPGMSGSAYVLEVPLGGGAGAMVVPEPFGSAFALPPGSGNGTPQPPEGMAPADAAGGRNSGGRRRARRSSVDAFLESDVPAAADGPAQPEAATAPTGRRRRRGPAAEEPALPAPEEAEAPGGTGRRRARTAGQDAAAGPDGPSAGAGEQPVGPDGQPKGPGGQPVGPGGLPVGAGVSEGAVLTAAEHAAGTAASGTGLGGTVPPQGVPAPAGRRALGPGDEAQAALPLALPAVAGAPADGGVPAEDEQPTGRRRRALAAATERAAAQEAGPRTVFALPPAEADRSADGLHGAGAQEAGPGQVQLPGQQGAGPARAGAAQVPAQGGGGEAPVVHGRHDAVPLGPADDHTPPQPHPAGPPTGRRRRVAAGSGAQNGSAGDGPYGVGPSAADASALALPGVEAGVLGAQALGGPAVGGPAVGGPVGGPSRAGQGGPGAAGQPLPGAAPPGLLPAGQPLPGQPVQPGAPLPAVVEGATPAAPAGAVADPAVPNPVGLNPVVPNPVVPNPVGTAVAHGQPLPAEAPQAGAPQAMPAAGPVTAGTPLPPEAVVPQPRAAQPLPAEAVAAPPVDPFAAQGRAISVRTLGQGVPFTRQAAQVQQVQRLPQAPAAGRSPATPAPHTQGGSGRRRKLGTRPDPAGGQEQGARPLPTAEQQPSAGGSMPGMPGSLAPVGVPTGAGQSGAGQSRLANATEGAGRSYAIGAPDVNAAEGPEPLDGPGGAVEVADPPPLRPMDDELPPEPLDNPRRLLVWPAPDAATQQALAERGYRPVIVHSREEVDAQIAAFPAALFVDPLTGPITRTALQSLREAAVAAEVPVMVTAGLGQATREAAYGADPAVLLKALAPRDSEQHPPRVLLVEEHAEIALALTAALERRGMQVARAAGDADAVALAGQLRPNLVVMDLLQMQQGQAGIVDWLRANRQLNRTPLVVYTAAVGQADLPRLASGETVLFLAERSTSAEVQTRIVDLLARIGTN